jgi:hypothetical protein
MIEKISSLIKILIRAFQELIFGDKVPENQPLNVYDYVFGIIVILLFIFLIANF